MLFHGLFSAREQKIGLESFDELRLGCYFRIVNFPREAAPFSRIAALCKRSPCHRYELAPRT